MKDDLGNRMKRQYEDRTRYFLPRRTYTLIRLDGKAFHTFARGLDKPFDLDLVWIMDTVTQYLCSKIQGCQFGYVQSDEISLLLTDFSKDDTDAWFDGNIQKIASVSASMATWKFNELMQEKISRNQAMKFMKYRGDNDSDIKEAMFDSRVFTIPDPIEVENYFVWRQKDAVRNSISMLAQSLYSPKQLHGKSQADQQDMIHEKGQNWNDLDGGLKRGRLIAKSTWDSDDYDMDYSIYNDRWPKSALDFLKNRDFFRALIPKIVLE